MYSVVDYVYFIVQLLTVLSSLFVKQNKISSSSSSLQCSIILTLMLRYVSSKHRKPMLTEETAIAGPFNVGNIDSKDTDSSFNRSFIIPPAAADLSIIDALARACRLASDRELAALLSVVELVVMATRWLANDTTPSPTGPADVAAAARLDNDDTLPSTKDDRFVGREISVNADDFSAATII